MKHSEEAFSEFVVAGCDGAVDLEMTDRALDAVAQPVKALVPADHTGSVRARRDDGADAARLEVCADGIGVVSLVCKHGFGSLLRQIDQDVVALAVRRFAAGEVEAERPAARIDDTVNFTGEPAPRAAKSLFASPPFAPAAETWPRTVVESML